MQNNFSILLRRISVLFFIYFLCRLLFYFLNFNYFLSHNNAEVLFAFIAGMRYDITAIVISNIFFISFHLLPFHFFYKRTSQIFLKIIYLATNIPFILLNCIDLGLFRFTGKRSGAEIFSIMSFGDDFINTAPKMVADFWYLLLLFILLIYFLIKAYPELKPDDLSKRTVTARSISKNSVLFLLFLFLTFAGFRGGLQYKPLNILSASKYNEGRSSSLILNTSFTVIKTIYKESLPELHLLADSESQKLSPVIIHPKATSRMNKKNVVIIILESFGKEYFGSLNNNSGYTLFLDSLIKHSLVFTNAFANGKRSIEGIPAVISGIPSLMPEPFITSRYSGNTITSIAALLKDRGYSSQFFHGGTNGTMGFDNFSKLAGFEKYFGRTEYNNDNDFDGSWGIYDGPFLKRTVTEMSEMKEPFLSAIFTLSSHHPYKIPDSSAAKLKPGTLPIHQSIRYADEALQDFFASAAHTKWFANTLFVITPDHTALSETPFYMSRTGIYSIPIIFYSRSDTTLEGLNNSTVQQIDILPSVMSYLHYDSTYFAFGKSVFDTSGERFAVNYMDGTYQIISENYTLISDLSDKNLFYNFSSDSTLKNDLNNKSDDKEKTMQLKLKSLAQNFNHAMIHNQMH